MPLLHKLNVPQNVGERKEGEPVEDCKWLLRSGYYIKTDGGYMERIGDSGKVFCMYTCTVTAITRKPKPDGDNPAFVTYEKVLKSDMSCCPHMNEINNPCPIINDARVLESYYDAHRKKKDSI